MILSLSPALPMPSFGSPWTPAMLTTPPGGWWSAKQLGGATGTITTIPDLSTAAKDFTSSGTARGTLNATGNNGYPSIDLDGVDDGYATASIGSASAWVFWIVGRLINYTTTKNIFSIDDYVPDSTYILMQMNGANAVSINSNVSGTPSVSAGAGTVRAYCIEGSTSGVTIMVNDGTSATAAGNFTKAASIMRLGRRGDGLYANWGFSEAIYVPGTMTAAEKTQMWSYLNRQWGVTTP